MYEVGDKVIYQGADKSAYKKVGVLKSIEEKDGKPQLTVEFEGGETFTAPVDDWSKEFTNAARNAKFKVGDVVSVKREAAEMIDNPALARKRGRVTKVLPGGYYEVDGELGATGLELSDAELTLANSSARNGVRSRNAVVAKALNACARNANFGSVEDAERYSEQEVRAAKSRINGEVVSLTDVIKLLKGYPDSKTVQKNLVTLQWALDAVKKAAQTLA
jgi:hypothetical protein